MKNEWSKFCANVYCPVLFIIMNALAAIAFFLYDINLCLLSLLLIFTWIFPRKNTSFTYFTISRPLFFKIHYWISQTSLPLQNIGCCPDKKLRDDFLAIANHIKSHPYATYHTYTHEKIVAGISSFCRTRPVAKICICEKDLRFTCSLINQSQCKKCTQNGACWFTKYSCYQMDNGGNYILDEKGRKKLNTESYYAVTIYPINN